MDLTAEIARNHYTVSHLTHDKKYKAMKGHKPQYSHHIHCNGSIEVVDTIDMYYTTSFALLYHVCRRVCKEAHESHHQEFHPRELKLTENFKPMTN